MGLIDRKIRFLYRLSWTKINLMIIAVVLVFLSLKLFSVLGDLGAMLAGPLGIRLQDVEIKGLSKIQETEVKQLIPYQRPLLEQPLLNIQQNIQSSIKWIKNCKIQRIFPNKLIIEIVERSPIAIWQNNQKHYLVDAEGFIINSQNFDASLPVILGEGAQGKFTEFLQLLRGYTEIFPKVRGLVLYGKRRWDLHFRNGLIVLLPEADPEQALDKLNIILRKQNLQNVRALDFRVAKRLIIIKNDAAAIDLPAK